MKYNCLQSSEHINWKKIRTFVLFRNLFNARSVEPSLILINSWIAIFVCVQICHIFVTLKISSNYSIKSRYFFCFILNFENAVEYLATLYCPKKSSVLNLNYLYCAVVLRNNVKQVDEELNLECHSFRKQK